LLSLKADPLLEGRTTGDWLSPVAGEKSVCSERERSSQSAFSPADVPLARRFLFHFSNS
jgi:hypothetical protein